ncbi:MAG: hypothetical protein Q4F65_12480 [Propionibacteriaceae bacterium]|nr:hypothetical protein [Propionibacteriaceae bacterium]
MTAPRFVVAGVAAALVLSGCAAVDEPEITVAPPSMGVVPEEYRTPSPTHKPPTPSVATPSGRPGEYIPGTRLLAGPEPGTALGPTGVAVLRFVPHDPAWSPTCRPATTAELADVEYYTRVGTAGKRVGYARGAPQAVDLPEAGWSVISYWGEWDDGEVELTAAVRGGGATSGLGTAWAGSHTHGGKAFADGPEAMRAARECLGGA